VGERALCMAGEDWVGLGSMTLHAPPRWGPVENLPCVRE
jgi:hypothetical protein